MPVFVRATKLFAPFVKAGEIRRRTGFEAITTLLTRCHPGAENQKSEKDGEGCNARVLHPSLYLQA